MVFRVDLEHFADAVKKLLGGKVVAVAARDGRTYLTSGDSAKGLVVVAVSGKPVADVKKLAADKGFEVISGEWMDAAEVPIEGCDDEPPYMAGVAYKSREDMPGIWMDAFPFAPNQSEVLKRMYDEFAETGEIGDVTFEEFLRLCNPNVVIVSPQDMARFARANREVIEP